MLKPNKKETPAKKPQTFTRQAIAEWGENCACAHLRAQGWRVLAQNWRSGRFGELDIIAREPSGMLVFVEVKTRRQHSLSAGFSDWGFDALNWRKLHKIAACAATYVARQRLVEGYRLDAIIVYYETVAAAQPPGLLSATALHHVEGINS
jgi:putative endonuclease